MLDIDEISKGLRPDTDKVITLETAKEYIKLYGGYMKQNLVNEDEVFWCSLFSKSDKEIAKFPGVPELGIDYETFIENQCKLHFVDKVRSAFRDKFTDEEWKMCFPHA